MGRVVDMIPAWPRWDQGLTSSSHYTQGFVHEPGVISFPVQQSYEWDLTSPCFVTVTVDPTSGLITGVTETTVGDLDLPAYTGSNRAVFPDPVPISTAGYLRHARVSVGTTGARFTGPSRQMSLTTLVEWAGSGWERITPVHTNDPYVSNIFGDITDLEYASLDYAWGSVGSGFYEAATFSLAAPVDFRGEIGTAFGTNQFSSHSVSVGGGRAFHAHATYTTEEDWLFWWTPDGESGRVLIYAPGGGGLVDEPVRPWYLSPLSAIAPNRLAIPLSGGAGTLIWCADTLTHFTVPFTVIDYVGGRLEMRRVFRHSDTLRANSGRIWNPQDGTVTAHYSPAVFPSPPLFDGVRLTARVPAGMVTDRHVMYWAEDANEPGRPMYLTVVDLEPYEPVATPPPMARRQRGDLFDGPIQACRNRVATAQTDGLVRPSRAFRW